MHDLHEQIVNSGDDNALSAADRNEGLARVGQALLSKLRTVQELCEGCTSNLTRQSIKDDLIFHREYQIHRCLLCSLKYLEDQEDLDQENNSDPTVPVSQRAAG